MPVQIKHKQLGTIETIDYTKWITSYNPKVWDIIRMWDIVKIYNVQTDTPRYQSTCEKTVAIDAISHPANANALMYEDVPNIDNRGKIAVDALVKSAKDNSLFNYDTSFVPLKKESHSFLGWLLKSKFVLYTKRNAKPAFVKTWKMIVAIFIFLLGCYLSSGNHFDKLIEWLKSYF